MASNTGNLGGVPPDEVVAGSVISVKTVLGDEYKGGVFAFDASAGILIIHENREYTTLKRNIRIINQSSIENIKILEKGPNQPLGDLPEVDLQLAQERFNEAMEAAVQADKRVREGVTPQVQALFDTLAKQYNCEWREATNMIHMPDLQLIIEAPYKPENCQGKEANALMHLKKVLTGIRQKQGMD